MMTNSTDHGGAAPNVALDKFYRLYGAIGFLPIMLLGLIVLFAIFVPHFLILPNVLNVLRSSSYLVILAVGQMLVLMVGGFDLSVGAVVFVLQNFTRMGRYIVAIGGNLQAAIVSGVPTRFYLVATYVLCSVFASISGLALTAQIGSGQAAINSQLTLESIAAAVIAGVSLKGGVGKVEMVALGALFLLILTNAMDLLKIDPRIQTIFLGIIVVGAVAVEELTKRKVPRV